MKTKKIAFIGCGNMGRCLIRGLITDGYPAEQICASDTNLEQLTSIAQLHPVLVSTDNQQIINNADVVVLAVKPQILKQVVEEVLPALRLQKPLVLSIAAGIRAATLDRWLGHSVPVVRAMPNTPSLVGSGATGLYATTTVSTGQREIAESILRAVGLTVWVTDEAMLDVVTAISGSGPAYFFLFMECMEKVAISMGLDHETARLLVLQTAFGAGKMALESPLDVATLRKQVTSPGGTTEQAILAFTNQGLENLVKTAIEAAHNRSEEMAKIFGEQ